jgi:predicted  nucleic acid-binding Zn-ribbon protein
LELEKRVVERTEDLAAKTAELERINRVFVDRELKMRELKARIIKLEEKEVWFISI